MSRLPDSAVLISKARLAEGSPYGFEVRSGARSFSGVVIRKNGRYYAYENKCRHLSVTLDARDGDFLSCDRKYLQCHLHGALYEIETGACIGGPCVGSNLTKVDVVEVSELDIQVGRPLGARSGNGDDSRDETPPAD